MQLKLTNNRDEADMRQKEAVVGIANSEPFLIAGFHKTQNPD